MDPGTALAAVSFAIQLASIVQTLNEFVRLIHDAPNELVSLIETMDLMQGNLRQVHYLFEQQFSDSSLAGSPVYILNALKVCERKVEAQKPWVEEIKRSLTTRHLMKRTWASLNLRPKKTQLSEMQLQLRDAMANLQFAVLNNQWHVQLQQYKTTTAIHQLQVTTNEPGCRPISITDDNFSITQRSSITPRSPIIPRSGIQYTQQKTEQLVAPGSSNSALHITSKEQTTIWYRGVFGVIATQEKWISSSRSASRTAGKPVPAKRVLTITSPFLGRVVELYFGVSFASIPRALRVYQIMEFDAPIIDMCLSGDLEGIQNEFANGTISPFVVDDCGNTLLHHAVYLVQPEMCSLLLRLGADPDRGDNRGEKPFSRLCYHFSRESPYAIGIARALAHVQEEFSSADLSICFEHYDTDPGLADYVLSLDSVQYVLASEGCLYPALGSVLRTYGSLFADNSVSRAYTKQRLAKWNPLVRRLLQIGVDIHAPVPRGYYFEPDSYPCALSPYGTPLDELFGATRTASEAKDAADAWLQILSTEGIDVLTYLEKEKALHETQSMFTYSDYYWDYQPRQLVFSLGEAPSVYADWWIDPESPASFIRQEFRDMNITTADEGCCLAWHEYCNFGWSLTWPIRYPSWDNTLKPYEWHVEEQGTWTRLDQRAQERADRRWHKKARKAARMNGSQAQSSMPGAWPE